MTRSESGISRHGHAASRPQSPIVVAVWKRRVRYDACAGSDRGEQLAFRRAKSIAPGPRVSRVGRRETAKLGRREWTQRPRLLRHDPAQLEYTQVALQLAPHEHLARNRDSGLRLRRGTGGCE